jgi:hypothetical protein
MELGEIAHGAVNWSELVQDRTQLLYSTMKMEAVCLSEVLATTNKQHRRPSPRDVKTLNHVICNTEMNLHVPYAGNLTRGINRQLLSRNFMYHGVSSE